MGRYQDNIEAANRGDRVAQCNVGYSYQIGDGVVQNDTQAAEWYQKAANQGDANAQYNLGLMYEKGRGVAQNDSKAVEWYQKAANQGYALAQCALGCMYLEGFGVAQNDSQAVEWYQKAANQGHALAQCYLGLMYAKGRGVIQNDSQEVEWYQKAANQGHAGAQYVLGVRYENGRGVTQNDTQAVEWYQKAANQGHANAQYALGFMYANGRGVAQNDTQAVEWFQKAANQGNAAAQYVLGVMYANGRGIAQNDTQSFEWWQKAANQGHANAQYGLGVRYEKGRGVTQNDTQAVEWYQKAANQGNTDAQYLLGFMYANGCGIAQNDTQSFEWYQKAANQGNADAQYVLGVMYAKGRGIAQNDSQAVEWYQKAANQGNADAQCSLGFMYANGRGIAQNDTQSFEWYQKAANQGNVYAQKNLQELQNKIRTIPTSFVSEKKAAALNTLEALVAKVKTEGSSSSSQPLDLQERLSLVVAAQDSFTASAQSSSVKPLPQMKTLYDYSATDSYQLTIKAGDIVQQLGQDPHQWAEQGWLYCQKGNVQGYVPKDYLQDLSAVASSATTASNSGNTTTTTTTATPTSATKSKPIPAQVTTSLSIAATQAQSNNKDVAQVLTQRISSVPVSPPRETNNTVNKSSFVSEKKVVSLNTLEALVAKAKTEGSSSSSKPLDLQQQLSQAVAAQDSLLKAETLSDYQKLAQELRAQAQAHKQAQEKELDALRAEIAQAKTQAVLHPDLIAKVKQLEQKLAPLVTIYEAQQTLAAQQVYLMSQENLARFYRILQGKLHGLFAACEVIDTGLVTRNNVGTAEKAAGYLTLATEFIPLPGAAGIGKCLSYIATSVAQTRADNKLHQIARQTVSYAEVDKLTEEVARRLAYCYEEQLLHLTPETSGILAESAMKLMLAFLWDGEFSEKSLADQLVGAVAQIKTLVQHNQNLAKLFQKIKDLKDKFQDTKLPTKANDQWTAFGVFQRSGLEITVDQQPHYYSGNGTQPEIYGYRIGTLKEALAANLKRTAERVPSRIIAAKKLAPSSEKHLDDVTQSNIQVQIETELLKKQVAHLNNRMAQMSAQGSSSSATSSPMINQHSTAKPGIRNENIADTIYIEGNTISLDLAEIKQDKHTAINTLMKDYAKNCAEVDIKRNADRNIFSLTLSNPQLVEKLKQKLISTLGLMQTAAAQLK